MKTFKYYLVTIMLFFYMTTFAAPFVWKLEVGQTDIHTNFFEIPKGSTRVYFPENRKQVTGRVYGTWQVTEKDQVRVLLAPFTAKATFTSASPVNFKGVSFAAGTPIDVSYAFNSYRVSYIRTWNLESNLRPHFGFTGKIRDAAIKLSNGSSSEERANIGFVPLLNAGFDFEFTQNWIFNFDVDAAAARQGRAIDGAIEFTHLGFSDYNLGIGYRVLDGGVSTDANLNFAQLRATFISIASEF